MGILTKKEHKDLQELRIHPYVKKEHEPKPVTLVSNEHHYTPLKNPRLLPENSRGEYK